jgi:hypothetical protein
MPKCKNCKDKFEPKTFLQKFCMVKPECVEIFVSEVKAKQWKKKKSEMKKDLLTNSDYLKLAQAVFNKFIRLRDQGLMCISCGKQMKEGNVDAGHLWSAGGHSNLRFNELNVNSQCSRPCNKDLSGDPNNYRIGFIKKYGKEKLDYLDSIAHVTKKWSKDELEKLITKYKAKCKELTN